MLLILSSRTIGEELASQFGPIPPAFLPVGMYRLFQLQLKLAAGDNCYMTVPDDYVISDFDRRLLEEAAVTVLPQPQRFSLVRAIHDAISRIQPASSIHILYGSTLIRGPSHLEPDPDSVMVNSADGNYPWTFINNLETRTSIFLESASKEANHRRLVCGYFHFSDPDILAAACDEPSIVGVLNKYHKQKPLKCVDTRGCLDFENLLSYYQSKKAFFVARPFNKLTLENGTVTKWSHHTDKIRAEANWYSNLPRNLSVYTPRYLGIDRSDDKLGYRMEYIHAPLLSELAVFGELPLVSWLEIIRKCFQFMEKLWQEPSPSDSEEVSPEFASLFFRKMIKDKTWSRVESFCEQGCIRLDSEIVINDVQHRSLGELIEQTICAVPKTTVDHIRLWHGDLFFGNILYQVLDQRIYVIDPRAQLESGRKDLWGDFRYDLAKLSHSILGQYDRILFGRSRLERSAGKSMNWKFSIENFQFMDTAVELLVKFSVEKCGIQEKELYALTALLFFSMLPIHSENTERQLHLLSRAVELAAEAQKKE